MNATYGAGNSIPRFGTYSRIKYGITLFGLVSSSKLKKNPNTSKSTFRSPLKKIPSIPRYPTNELQNPWTY